MVFRELFLLLLSLIFPVLSQALFLNTSQGTLKGKILKSRNGHEFYAFYGIPYVQSPINQLRFQPPQRPPPAWEGTRDATDERAFCPQMNTWFRQGYLGAEDCLFLHVSSRDVKPRKLLPVLVYIHGGSFTDGGGILYDANFFMDQPIVFVTFNYRLGVLGFLSSGDSAVPGNYGLKDQVAALQWIQENIRSFGGDPSTVTIMGHSSGAACVHHHVLSPSSKDLFHRAIIQSGVSTLDIAYSPPEQTKRSFHNFLQHANCSRSSTNESVACLSALSVERLKQLEDTFPLRYPNSANKFMPVIEPSENEGAFMIADPHEFAYPTSNKTLIIGFTTNEIVGVGTLYKTIFPPNMTDEKVFNAEMPKKLLYNSCDNPELTQNITSLIKQLYFQNDLSNLNNDKASSFLLSDMWFKFDIVNSIRGYPGVKYVYEYNYVDRPAFKGLGAGHAHELRRFFSRESDFKIDEDPHRKVSETLITYWSNFVSSGDPNAPDNEVPVQWDSMKEDTEEHVYISEDGLFRTKKGLMIDKGELMAYVRECLKPTALKIKFD